MRSNLVQITSKIMSLAKSGSLSCARKLFDEMPHRDTIAWNAMISGYSQMRFQKESLSLFNRMRFSHANPDHFTYTAVLSACAGLKDVKFGRGFHALVIVSGCSFFLPVNNALIDMYGKCLRAEEANRVFEEMGLRNEFSWCSMLFAYVNVGILDISQTIFFDMPKRVIVAWNTIISGFAKWGEVELCLELFKKMLLEEPSCSPDQWTLSAVINACAETSDPCYGFMLHGFVIRSGWHSAAEVNNSILSFYVKFGEKNEVMKAVEAFQICNDISRNVIIDAYMSTGNLEEAFLVFQRVPEKNLISWTSMITGCMKNGHAESALRFFLDLTKSHIKPDDITLGTVLHSCSNLATLGHGRMVHGLVVQSGFCSHSYIGNGLVNMYAKCGDISDAYRAFNDVRNKDLISWNTMLFAFGLHGHSDQALHIFNEMLASNVKPDKVTFIGLLMTCSHLGMIEEGLSFFESMTLKYGLSPEIDHISCVVDMLSRCGKFEKAKEFANRYIEANDLKVSSLEILFGSCSFRGSSDLGVGEELAGKLKILKPSHDMSYVLMSNLYCASGQWKRAQLLRKDMVERGVRKKCGCSWIEVRNRVTAFVAGNNSFPFVDEVCVMLSVVESEIRYPVSIRCWDGVT